MLTLEENGWNFKAIKIASALNLLPIEINLETGKIERQSNKIRVFMWKALFCVTILDLLYKCARLVQSTVMEPEKYFRWDHFVIHFPAAFGFSVLFSIGLCTFVLNPEELMMIFNRCFEEREDPVQKMMDEEQKEKEQELKMKLERESGSASVADQEQTPDSDSENNSEAESDEEPDRAQRRPLLSWPPQYSLDELIARVFSHFIFVTNILVIIIFAADPSHPQLLYSSLPAKYQGMYSFCGLLAVEHVVLTLLVSFLGFSVLCQLLFFAKCQLEFKQMDLQLRKLEEKFQSRSLSDRDIKREIWILRQILAEMKELVLFLELFNRCFAPCIFAFKLCCFLSILFYFFTVCHIQDFPMLGVFTGYIAVVLTLTYGILYEKAFSIPEKMKWLKREFLVTANKSTSVSKSIPKAAENLKLKSNLKSKPTRPQSGESNSNLLESFRAEMKREIRRIRSVGIKVGSFHNLERATTPNFIDFVLKNVVNLLVTFS